MVALQTLDELKDWKTYRVFLKERLKQLAPDGAGDERIFVSRTDLEFDLAGKPWSGRAVFVGEKGVVAAKRFKQQGVLMLEGSLRLEGKTLLVAGLPAQHVKKAQKTMKKLVLGYELVASDLAGDDVQDSVAETEAEHAEAADSEGADELEPDAVSAGGASGELAGKAGRIERAVEVWRVTERVATGQLRKLQKAILELRIDASAPVIRGLERILTRLEKIDDVALAAAEAAERGDAAAFEEARDRLRRKLAKMLDYVRKDPLIADADQNPMVPIRLAETLGKSLTQLLKAV